MARWFRFYDEVLDDPKVQRLPPDLFKGWVNLLCMASKCNGKMLLVDVSFALRVTPEYAEELLNNLVEFGLLVFNGGCYVPHNWAKRQYKSDVSTNRVKQFRKRQRNVSETASEQSRTDTDTEIERKKEKKERKVPPLVEIYPPPIPKVAADNSEIGSDEDEFWKLVPAMMTAEISKSRMGMLIKFTDGDFTDCLRIARRTLTMQNPSAYLAKVVQNLKAERAEEDAAATGCSVPGEPAFIAPFRRDGVRIEKLRENRWKIGAAIYDETGDEVGG